MSEYSIEKFVRNEIDTDERIDHDTDLIESGLLDSLDFLKLISAIEGEYGITVDFGEIDPNELTCFDDLVRSCERLVTEKSAVKSKKVSSSGDVAKIIFIGNGRPIRKVLSEVEDRSEIHFTKLYTNESSDSEIAQYANSLDIEVQNTQNLLSSGPDYFESPPDYIFNVNSTVVFPEELLTEPKKGCVNLHPGKLPEYAGLHTHQWALINDEEEFGATLHWMTKEIDAGDIIYRDIFLVDEDDNGLKLFLKAIDSGTELVKRALKQIAKNEKLPSEPQDTSRRQVYRSRDIPNGEIDWYLNTREVYNFVRAADYGPFESPTYDPYTQIDGTEVTIRNVKTGNIDRLSPGQIRILKGSLYVGTGDGAVEIIKAEINGTSMLGKDVTNKLKLESGMEI